MAIVKNTAKAAEPKAKPAAVKPAVKPAAKAAAPKVVAKAAPKEASAEVEKVAVESIGRKEISASIREKVMATGAGVSVKVVETCVVAIEEAITEALIAGKKVTLPGFGVFSTAFREAREATNPQDPTGAKINVAACIVPKFKPGSKLKAAVNGGAEVAGEDGGE